MSAMDERQLGELFRTAAASVDPPTAGFDHDDVLAGSRRVSRRQRALVTAAVVAVAGLGVGAVAGGGLARTGPASTLAEAPAAGPSAASGPSPESGPADARDSGGTGSGGAGSGGAVPDAGSGGATLESAPASGAAPNAAAPKMAPTPFAAPPGTLDAGPTARSKAAPGFVAGCAKPDAEVFAQLTAVLPEPRGRTARPVPGGCAEGGVGAAVTVNGGTLAVVLTPAGVPDPKPADNAGRRSVVVEARSGRVLRLTATAPDGPPPYRDRLRDLADELGGRL